MTDDITRAAALLRANGWTVLPPGKSGADDFLFALSGGVVAALLIVVGLLMLAGFFVRAAVQ